MPSVSEGCTGLDLNNDISRGRLIAVPRGLEYHMGRHPNGFIEGRFKKSVAQLISIDKLTGRNQIPDDGFNLLSSQSMTFNQRLFKHRRRNPSRGIRYHPQRLFLHPNHIIQDWFER